MTSIKVAPTLLMFRWDRLAKYTEVTTTVYARAAGVWRTSFMIPRPQRARCTLLPRESADRPNTAAFTILAAALVLSPLLALVPAPAAASMPSVTHSLPTAKRRAARNER